MYFVGLLPLGLSQRWQNTAYPFMWKWIRIDLIFDESQLLHANVYPPLKSFETQQTPTNEGRESCIPSELVSRSTSTNELQIYWYPLPWFDCRVYLRCVVVAQTCIEQSVVTLCQGWGTERGRISLTPYQSAGCVLCCASHWPIKWTVFKTNSGCCWCIRLLVFSLPLGLSTWRRGGSMAHHFRPFGDAPCLICAYDK
jgi:hypothetical protein